MRSETSETLFTPAMRAAVLAHWRKLPARAPMVKADRAAARDDCPDLGAVPAWIPPHMRRAFADAKFAMQHPAPPQRYGNDGVAAATTRTRT